MDSSLSEITSSIAELEFDENDFLVGEEYRITIIGPRKSGKTSLVNKLVSYPLLKPSLVESRECVFRTHLCKHNGIRILDMEQTAIHSKSFTSREELREFWTSQEENIQNFSSVDIFIAAEKWQRVCVVTELPESVLYKDWFSDFSTDVLIFVVGISDICVTHPEKLRDMLSASHKILVSDITRETYFVSNKWDTLNDDDEDSFKRESQIITSSFKTTLAECWPVTIRDDHLFRTSFSKTPKFIEDLETLKKGIQNSATAYFHFTADEAMEKALSITKSLSEFLHMEEFQEHFKNELPNLLDSILSNQKENESTEAVVVVAGDTSAGKTSFINKLLGRQIFAPRTLASTACVCRIRKSEEVKIKLFTKENELLFIEDIEDATLLLEKLRRYTELDKKEPINGRDIHYVDIYMPSETLQNNMVLVDTPGIGFKESLDNILFDYLPNASCFIFVVDAANAGGIREDRLVRILKIVVEKQKEMPFFDIKDAMFLTNKWDNVESEDESSDEEFVSAGEESDGGSEKQKTYTHILETLSREWPALSRDNVYQVCLKKDKGDYEDDFNRFKIKLLDVVEKTKRRLICDNLRATVNVFANVERIIYARFDAQKMNDEQHAEYKSKVEKFLPEFQQLCLEGKQLLQSNITSVVLVFASKIHFYLRSKDAKAEILAHVRPHKITTIHSLKNEIACLLTCAVQSLMEGEKTEEMVKALDKMVRDYTRAIEKRAQQMEGEVFQVNMPFYAGLNDYNANITSVFMALVPCTLSFQLIERLPINMELSDSDALQEHILEHLLKNVTVRDIEMCLDVSITEKYRRAIDRIHNLYLKKEESLKEYIANIGQERESMREHMQLYERLIEKIGNIRRFLRPIILNMRREDSM